MATKRFYSKMGSGTTLQGHVARANPLAQADAVDVLVVFQGAESYISPSWCASKQHDPALVPTWNYTVVHVNGQLQLRPDKAWLFDHLADLSQHSEQAIGQRWQLSDAPEDYINRLSSVIVGIEISMDKLIGKWKTSITQAESNLHSVTAGLKSLKRSASDDMADLITQRYQP